MTTEILGFLIIVGALIVFIVRRDLWNGLPNKTDEVEEASVRMRLQMEHSADEIIARMESRIRHLESLVTTADERAHVLERQLAAARADQERAAMQAEQRYAAMRAAQGAYYMGGGSMAYAEPEAAWQEMPYRMERRAMHPVDGIAPVRRMEARPRMIAAYDAGEEDFAETLSASMRAEETHYPRAYEAQASREAGQYGQSPYGGDHRDESAYIEPHRDATQHSFREGTWRPAARIMDAEMMHPAEMAVEETPAAVLDAPLAADRGTVPEAEPEEDEPFFSKEALEELAHIEPEIVVSPSVADVVDLPLDPEENEETAPQDEALGDGVAIAKSEEAAVLSVRLHAAAGGEPLKAEPIHDSPLDAPTETKAMPASEMAGEPEEADAAEGGVPIITQEDSRQDETRIGQEPAMRQTANSSFMQDMDAGHLMEDDARAEGSTSDQLENEPPLAGEAMREMLAPEEPGIPLAAGHDDVPGRETAEAEPWQPEMAETPEASRQAPFDASLAGEMAAVPLVRESPMMDDPSEVASFIGAETGGHVAARPNETALWAESRLDLREQDEAAPKAEPDSVALAETQEETARELSSEEGDIRTGSGTAATGEALDSASDWMGSLQTADAEAADMELFADEEPEEAVPPVSGNASPTGRARELLAQGMTTVDVARATGMGRSAVELLAQMQRSERNASA